MTGEGLDFEAATVALERLDGYVLHERVGEGGMGIVHRASDPRGNIVAVKLLRPQIASDADSRARFAREARVLSRVRGSHIAEVLDADVVSETPYLVTRFVQGPPLSDVVQHEGPLHGGDLADLAGDLADALRSIHAAGVVHRDLKPANVLLQNTGQGRMAILVDFGIAQLADETRMTMTGMVYGTPGYVAPEVLSGRDVTPAADIHAWASVVSFAATGRQPFGTGPLEAVAWRVLQDEPDLDGCPDWLRPVLQRCFSKRPDHRPSGPELLHWLETGEAPPPPPVQAVVYPDAEPPPPARPLGTVPMPEQQGFHPVPPPQHRPGPPPQIVPDPVRALAAYNQRTASVHVLGLGLMGVLAALAASLPLVAAAAALSWLVLARMVDRAIRFMDARRTPMGRSKSAGLLVVLAMPWHAARAALITALTAPVAVGGAVIVTALGGLVSYATGLQPRLDLLLTGGTALGVLFAWWGFDGQSVRTGTRQALAGIGASRAITIIVCFALAAAIGLLATYAMISQPDWWPIFDVAKQLPERLRPLLTLE